MVNYPPSYLPTHQKRFELEWLLEIFRLRKPKRILEVGTAEGGTLWAWSHNCEPGATIVSIDWFHPEYDNREQTKSWQENGSSIISVQGDCGSPEIVAQARNLGPYEWFFLDADHTYNSAMRDWCNYMPMVVAGGIIAFHDITPNGKTDIEVSKLWAQIQKDGWRTISIMENSNNDTCGIGVVFKQ